MIQKKKTKYELELSAEEYATFIAAISTLDRDRLVRHFGKYLDENIHDILVVNSSSMLETLIINCSDSCVVPSDIIKKVIKEG